MILWPEGNEDYRNRLSQGKKNKMIMVIQCAWKGERIDNYRPTINNCNKYITFQDMHPKNT